MGYVVRPDIDHGEGWCRRVRTPVLAHAARRGEVRGSRYETPPGGGMKRQVPQASTRVPNAALVSQGGGVVTLDPRESSQALSALQGCRGRSSSCATHPTPSARVYVRFEHGWEPLAFRLYRSQVRQLFMKRFRGVMGSAYPEREVPREGVLDRLLGAAEYFGRKLPTPGCRSERDHRRDALAPLRFPSTIRRMRLRREGFTEKLAGRLCAGARRRRAPSACATSTSSWSAAGRC